MVLWPVRKVPFLCFDVWKLCIVDEDLGLQPIPGKCLLRRISIVDADSESAARNADASTVSTYDTPHYILSIKSRVLPRAFL